MMKHLQKLGKALMLPVAVLPICGILMGLGLFQGLVVPDCHFAALLQRQRLLGIHRNWHKSHSDQC